MDRMGHTLKQIIKLLGVLIGCGALGQMILFFIVIWVQDEVWFGEPNLWIRTIESIMFVFGFIVLFGLSVKLFKELIDRK